MEVTNVAASNPFQITIDASQKLGTFHTARFVCIGDVIDEGDVSDLIKGHGIRSFQNKLIATVSGKLERINKLISVCPLKCRYHAEVGDVVIGRIIGIIGGQWKVDINAQQDALIGLSSVFVPGQIQRRKTAEDESNMRQIFKETDLISAEIQTVRHDGGINLHTRSQKYGKLGMGCLMNVAASLVQRQRQHFHVLNDIGVEMIFGCNGNIWIMPSKEEKESLSKEEKIQNVARLCAAIGVIEKLNFPIQLSSVVAAYHLSLETGCPVHEMEREDFLTAAAQGEFLNRMQP